MSPSAEAASAAGPFPVPLHPRLGIIRRFRQALAEDAAEVAQAVAAATGRATQTTVAETLTSQVIPLLDACRFLERRAVGVLRDRRVGAWGRPMWLWGVTSRVVREPWGTVLILGASNYPLLLPGVQALQAIVAGNAVVLKPGRGTRRVAELLRDRLERAGLPPGVLRVLDDSAEAGERALADGPDHVVLTGSAATGRRVLAACGNRLIPATVELSGCDAVFVLEGANLDLLARGLAFGLRLHSSRTCIAPRRVLIPDVMADALIYRLRDELARHDTAAPGDPDQAAHGEALAADAVAGGAHHLADAAKPRRDGSEEAAGPPRPLNHGVWPIVLDCVTPDMAVARADVFAPLLSVIRLPNADPNTLLRADAACPYALGASIWGPRRAARAMAARVRAGSVAINDLIMPTADPRLPFGGTGESGFGSTRGPEGLLAMTRPRCISLHRGTFRPHYDPPTDGDVAVFSAFALAAHGSRFQRRFRAAMRGARLMLRRGRNP